MTTDPIAERLKTIVWDYDKDASAQAALRQRIEDVGRRFGLISYSNLVKGIDFHFPNINNGRAYRITTHDWSGLDRRIVGDCLGSISRESYLNHGFMASALVVARQESKPSDIFFGWMEDLGVLPNLREETVLAFWVEQVKKAHHWYKYGKQI